jgi:hypothetical protein
MHAVQQGSIVITSSHHGRPVGPLDQGAAGSWWGWSWQPAVPLSITELVAARDFDARTAAVAWLVMAGHGSLLVAARQPHAGKTTILTALLDLVPSGVTRIDLRGAAETFASLDRSPPLETLLVANELSTHLPAYLWGANAVRAFGALRDGYALASTLHADSAVEAIARLRDELGAAADDLARVDVVLVMRDRRLVSLDRLRPAPRGPVPERLVREDPGSGGWIHDDVAEARLVGERQGWSTAAAARAIAERTDRIIDLLVRGVFATHDVKSALAPLNDLNGGGPA